MCKRGDSDISESFVRGLNAISEKDKAKFSVKSKEVKSIVREGLLG